MLDRRQVLRAAAASPAVLFSGSALAREEKRAGGAIVHTRDVPNSEPAPGKLVENWITPVEHFYVRSHAPTPRIAPADYRLTVGGMVDRPLELSLADLRAMPQQTVTATMTCAGNRREEHSRVKPVGGVQWQAGAIGNATWTGVPLAAVLRKAGVAEGAEHVWFDGLDRVQRASGVIPFGASIPLGKAMADHAGTPGALVVHIMNGQPLTPDHGFPVRTVVPGYIGARSVKWLGRITVSDRPHTNHYVATAYKLVEEDTAAAWAAADPLETFVLNSVTCVPAAGDTVAPGVVTVRGYALAAGLPGRTVRRVELSIDEGRSWFPARFSEDARPLCWRLWSAPVRVTPAMRSLVVRAIDSTGAVQPETVEWNLKGYQFNAWHRTPVSVG
ncbi:MAG: sulfite oxidase [Planctomycetota bacterium]